jgi:hypothetical protein
MQRKPSYYLKTCVAAVIGAASGFAMALPIETTHAINRSNVGAYFVKQAYARDAFVPSLTPSIFVPCNADCVDQARECGAGIETECIYL